MTSPSDPSLNRIGVIGSGTMGSGIALSALYADLHVVLYDISPEMLTQAQGYIEKFLLRKKRAINLQYLTLSGDLTDLAGCGVVIEAAPEKLSLKEELFAKLDELCPPPAILATNTSTLSVTTIAAATETSERVAGMHFFNPAPVLPLVEIIRGARTSQKTIDTLVRLVEKLDKTPVVARDTPGFIVNRVARPFYGEALRLLGEGTATHEQIDRLVRDGSGFRMGPFELMDLIGIDVNYAATQSVYEQTFNEPRYRPHLIQARMVGQKALGRKSGRGFYDYSGEQQNKSEPSGLAKAESPGKTVTIVEDSWAPGLVELCRQAGYAIHKQANTAGIGLAAAGRGEDSRGRIEALDRDLPAKAPLICQCADATLAEIASWTEHPERLVGFDGFFLEGSSAITLVAGPGLDEAPKATAVQFFHSLGLQVEWVADSPGLVLPRIVCALANEAAFAVGEGVADGDTIDRAMQLGTNYPFGPLAWAKDTGYAKVVAVLDHLYREYGEERYRVAPPLRRWSRLTELEIS